MNLLELGNYLTWVLSHEFTLILEDSFNISIKDPGHRTWVNSKQKAIPEALQVIPSTVILTLQGIYWACVRSAAEAIRCLNLMISLFIKILSNHSKINHFDNAILNTEIIRLDISVDIFCNFMQTLNSIKHTKHYLSMFNGLYGIIDSLINALINELHLNDICVFKKYIV